ncbi:MAG: SUMF1/EgtB/PvdO family nonheme iron enzyme [Desulfobacterales bacterium]|nr:SUMF1/EgtB/PvdO family nonheme iron enzyme [Desulfobacterales bacterium]
MNSKENVMPENQIVQAKPVQILSDNPESENAEFGFEAYIKTISDLISYNKNKTPFTIGIYGSWGTGKTTLMKSIKKSLDDDQRYKTDNDFRITKTMWFQPWKHGKEDEILAALIEEIFHTMEEDGLFNAGKAEVEKLVKGVNGKKLFGAITKAITKVDISEIFTELPHKKNLGFYDVFKDFFKDLIWTYLNWRPKLTKEEKTNDKNGALVIFIDDLDRCPRSKIISVLESIKLFMDLEGCIFILGAANDIIANALWDTYKEDANDFMGKIVQVTFNLPKIPPDDFIEYLNNLEEFKQDDISEYLPILIPALENNPRNLKRFVNNFSLMESLLANKKVNIKRIHLFLWLILEYKYSGFLKSIKGNEHGNFETMQKLFKQIKEEDPSYDLSTLTEKMEEKIKLPDSLKEYFKDKDLLTIIDKLRCSKEEIEQLITLTTIVESTEDVKRKIDIKGRASFEIMNLVKKGSFLYGDDKQEEIIDHDFQIDIYPVTNERYKKFISAGGYSNKDYWDEKGWNWKNEDNIFQPVYLSDKNFNDPEQPVVGVSFYEAQAFCKWLTKSRNDGYGYRLLDEKEWEKAARGDKGLKYPWGDEFDKEKCNSKESGINKTTRVTVYPNGISPYGCYDMAGNVWEWTSSPHENHEGAFVLRGGSFFSISGLCRCANRFFDNPDVRYYFIGFRCSRIKL